VGPTIQLLNRLVGGLKELSALRPLFAREHASTERPRRESERGCSAGSGGFGEGSSSTTTPTIHVEQCDRVEVGPLLNPGATGGDESNCVSIRNGNG